MNGNRNGSSLRERRQGDFELQSLRRDVDTLTAIVGALQKQLEGMIKDYNTGIGVLSWFKWLSIVGGGVATGVTVWKGWR